MPMKTTHHSVAVLAYAQSLLDLANDQKQAEPIGEELGQVRDVIEQNPSFGIYLADPAISHDERAGMLKELFAGKVASLLWNFIGVVNLKNRLKDLPEIAAAYKDLLDEQLGKIEVDVTVAQRLPDDQLEHVRQQISAALKKDVVVHQFVHESIIGGMMLRVKDKLIDASVRNQLQSIRENLLAARPR
jgi:F-type H+-transporting ATPase subunit delta